MFTSKIKFITLALLTMLLFTITSCNEDDPLPEPEPTESFVSFVFEHSVDDDQLTFNDIIYSNAFGNQYSVETLRYIISDIVLTRTNGTKILIDKEHYVDALVSETTIFDPDLSIPVGEYSSVAFKFGISKEKNLPGLFPNPPENNMEWPPAMGIGYHYMKLEGKIDSSGTISNFQAHTGPTMNNDNSFEVSLQNSSFTTPGSSTNIVIRMDINKWWQSPDILDLNNVTGIMGNQDMQLKLKANGADVFSFEGLMIPIPLN
jgi:hypothetical protein